MDESPETSNNKLPGAETRKASWKESRKAKKEFEKDEVKNYILIPTRVKDKDGKEYTASWEIFELHKDNTPIWYRYWDSKEERDIIK